jgi:hypothetical protein
MMGASYINHGFSFNSVSHGESHTYMTLLFLTYLSKRWANWPNTFLMDKIHNKL